MNLEFVIGLLYVLVAIFGILKINSRPDMSFWLIMNMYFDPGGYISVVSDRFIDRIDFQDVLIVFIIISISRIRNRQQVILHNPDFVKFLKRLFLFSIFYFIVFGGIIPFLKNDFNYGVFLLKNRRFVYGIILLIGVYLFALRGTKYLYQTTLFVGAPTLILFWLSLTTPIHFMEYVSMERYIGSEMIRIGMTSYGLFEILFLVAAIVYFFNQKIIVQIKNKRLLYFMGMLLLLSLLVSLTRRTILDIFGSIFIIAFVVSKLTKTTLFSVPLKLILPVMGVILMLLIVKPAYINYFANVTSDTFLLLTTGKDTRGESEKRISGTGIYTDVFDEIKDNALLGTGYTYYHWEFEKSMGSTAATSTRGLSFGQLADAAAEIPILNMFFSFGVIGFLFLMPLYLMLFKLARKLFRLLKQNFIYLFHEEPLTVVFSVLYILMIAKLFTYNIWGLGDQFIGSNFQINAVWFGLGFALLHKNIVNLKKNKNHINEDTNISSSHG